MMHFEYVFAMEILLVMLLVCVHLACSGFKDASICLCAGFSLRDYF